MKRRAQWPGDAVTKWQDDEDAKVLDPRTAAVLALGERVLREAKTHTPMTPTKELESLVRRSGGAVVAFMDDADLIAALAADAEATE